MTPAKLTYKTRDVPTDPDRALPYPLQSWSFVLERVDGGPVDNGYFECAGKKDDTLPHHAWGAAISYFQELGYHIEEVVEFAPVPA